MKVHKCDRCGKDIEVKKASEMEEIKCNHCNKEYVIDKKTNNKIMFLSMFFIVLASFVAVFLAQLLKISTLWTIIPLVLLGFFGKPILLKFLHKINMASYIEK